MKTAIVTGGASGIGYEIAKSLSKLMNVIVMDKCKSALQKIYDEFGGRLETACVDVSHEGEVDAAFQNFEARFGHIDVLINNAGVSERAQFIDTDMAHWNRVIATNLTGVFLMTRAFARQSPQHQAVTDQIINIASASGLVGMPNYAAYNVSKAGVIELTKTLALELAPRTHTCAICPGYILTPMQVAEYSSEALEACANENPSKRLGQPSEVAELVAFLLSGKSNYFNGSIIVMDGGETAGGMAS